MPTTKESGAIVESQPYGDMPWEVVDFVTPTDEGLESYARIHGRVKVEGCPLPTRWTAGIPEADLRSDRLHLITSGFGGFKRSSRALRNALIAQEQIVTVSNEPIRFGGFVNDLFDPQKAHYDAIEAVTEDIANHPMLPDLTNGNLVKFDRTHLVAHSMGSLAATAYALDHPDEVSQLTIIEGVGAEGAARLELVQRLVPFHKLEVAPAVMNDEFCDPEDRFKMLSGIIKYYGINLVRTGGEIWSCLNADIRPALAALGEAGVFLALLYGDADNLIPAGPAMRGAAHLVDYHKVMPGLNHLGPQVQSKAVARELGIIADLYQKPHDGIKPDSELAVAA